MTGTPGPTFARTPQSSFVRTPQSAEAYHRTHRNWPGRAGAYGLGVSLVDADPDLDIPQASPAPEASQADADRQASGEPYETAAPACLPMRAPMSTSLVPKIIYIGDPPSAASRRKLPVVIYGSRFPTRSY